MAISTGTKYLRVYLICDFEGKKMKIKFGSIKASKSYTYDRNHSVDISFPRQAGLGYNALDKLKKSTFVVFTNVEVTAKGTGLTHLSKVN